MSLLVAVRVVDPEAHLQIESESVASSRIVMRPSPCTSRSLPAGDELGDLQDPVLRVGRERQRADVDLRQREGALDLRLAVADRTCPRSRATTAPFAFDAFPSGIARCTRARELAAERNAEQLPRAAASLPDVDRVERDVDRLVLAVRRRTSRVASPPKAYASKFTSLLPMSAAGSSSARWPRRSRSSSAACPAPTTREQRDALHPDPAQPVAAHVVDLQLLLRRRWRAARR